MNMQDKKISQRLQDKVNRELVRGEHITWIDKPVPQFFTTRSTSYFVFAIPWTVFSVSFMLHKMDYKLPDFNNIDIDSLGSLLFSLLFVLIGISMLFNPIVEFIKTSNTIYIITNKRAIAFDGKGLIKSYYPHQLSNIYRKDKNNGLGDILLGKRIWRDSEGDEYSEDTGFLNIKNPLRIERMLTALASVN